MRGRNPFLVNGVNAEKEKNEKKNGRRHAVADADWTLAQGDLIEIPERRQFLHVKKPVQFLPDRERTPKTSPLA